MIFSFRGGFRVDDIFPHQVEFKSLPQSRTTASGGSDPRTATTLILFEEFVPLEYRQQLAVTSSGGRRRLPSLFSQTGKSKQWKQAATLNGRPYVVGHVPLSPTYREVEFEGLLRGGSATKVISLGNKASMRAPPSRAMSTVSSDVNSEAPSTPRTAGISAPLYVPTPEPPPAPPKSEEMHSDSTMAASVASTKRTSRFRLPGGIPVPSPGGSRKTGIAPAEYSSVDFETRLASYSDDEYSGVTETEAVKQARRETKDDAWVDILVGSQDRRMGGQDAELTPAERRRGIRGRRSDPEIASMEVAQVLAAVQDRTPSPPSFHERVDHDYGMDHFHDQDVDEIETVPRTSKDQTEDESIDEDMEPDLDSKDVDEVDQLAMSARQMARQQRRLGYFDLHPERRPQPADLPDDDPRDRLAHDEDSADETDEDSTPKHSQSQPQPTAPPLRKLPTPPSPPRVQDTPVPVANQRQLEPPAPSVTQNGNGSHEPKSATPSKTAALIEMYRERERGTPPKPTGPVPAPIPTIIAPLQPSRLPVRSASLPKETALPPQGLPIATPSPKTSPKPSPSLDAGQIELPRVPLDETGRASPARYVHGAPLHNVLEEEEEEV